jgi:hypothetical protein
MYSGKIAVPPGGGGIVSSSSSKYRLQTENTRNVLNKEDSVEDFCIQLNISTK